jgi:hypothetical protein
MAPKAKKETDVPNLALRAHAAARHVGLQPAPTQDLNLAGFDWSFRRGVLADFRAIMTMCKLQLVVRIDLCVQSQLSHLPMRRQRTQQL